MRNFTSTLIICLFSLQIQAQVNNLNADFFQQQYEEEIQSLTVEADVWRVDSIYCWTQDPATGSEILTARNYNLEFSEYSGQILLEQRQQFIEGAWINSLRKTYLYDAEDNLQETVDENWSIQQSIWENSDKNLYTFNENADDFENIKTQRWEDSMWNDRFQTTNSFHPTHFELTQSDNQIWENNEWVVDSRFYFSVNANTLLREGILFQKRNEAGILANLSRTFFFYDEMGNDTLSTYELNNDGWFFFTRVRKEFEGNKETLKTEQAYNADTETWVNTTQTTTAYLASGQRDFFSFATWNAQEGAFIPSYRTTYMYDDAGNSTDFITDVYQNGAWIYNGRCQLYWSEYEVVVDPGNTGTATEDILLQDCKIANPIQAGDTFSCTDWQIEGAATASFYDLNGRKVAQQSVTDQNSIEISENMISGLYFLVLEDIRGLVWHKKIVVQ